MNQANKHGVFIDPETVEFKANAQTGITIYLATDDERWYYGYLVIYPGGGHARPIANQGGNNAAPTKETAFFKARKEIAAFLEGVMGGKGSESVEHKILAEALAMVSPEQMDLFDL